MKPKNFLESLNCAAEGVIEAVKSQSNLKIHFVVLFFVIILSLVLNITLLDFSILMTLSAIVIMAELFNTAIEYMLDTFTQDFHITIKYVKDIAAGAVLFVSMLSILVGVQIVAKYILYEKKDFYISENIFFISTLSIFLSILFVILLKGFLRSGRPFRGGMPSGHAAVSFSIFTSLYLSVDNPYIVIAAFLGAIAVSFSRFLLGIHKKNEVIYGALIGTITTLILHRLFYK